MPEGPGYTVRCLREFSQIDVAGNCIALPPFRTVSLRRCGLIRTSGLSRMMLNACGVTNCPSLWGSIPQRADGNSHASSRRAQARSGSEAVADFWKSCSLPLDFFSFGGRCIWTCRANPGIRHLPDMSGRNQMSLFRQGCGMAPGKWEVNQSGRD